MTIIVDLDIIKIFRKIKNNYIVKVLPDCHCIFFYYMFVITFIDTLWTNLNIMHWASCISTYFLAFLSLYMWVYDFSPLCYILFGTRRIVEC